jgi:manganese oxidase
MMWLLLLALPLQGFAAATMIHCGPNHNRTLATATLAHGEAPGHTTGEEGDWAFHCHKSHHTMNAMGQDVPTMIGVDHRGIAKKITQLIPDYMVMAERGMADMAEVEMPLPDNSAPMMTGDGPVGSVEMGGMFSMLKVRKEQKAGDNKHPGWYQHPKGTVAFEWTGARPEPARFQAEGGQSMPTKNMPMKEVEVQVRNPIGHKGH